MTARTVKTILFKELLDTFRDKRMLVAMNGVPILLYPLLFVLATQAALVQQSRTEEQISRVAVLGPGADDITKWLRDAGRSEVAGDPTGDGLKTGALDAIVEAKSDVAKTLSEGGRASKVENPSPQHATLSYRTPRTRASGTIISLWNRSTTVSWRSNGHMGEAFFEARMSSKTRALGPSRRWLTEPILQGRSRSTNSIFQGDFTSISVFY